MKYAIQTDNGLWHAVRGVAGDCDMLATECGVAVDADSDANLVRANRLHAVRVDPPQSDYCPDCEDATNAEGVGSTT